ncbi:uncharacterized protein BJX67DRAFT_377643 [Aspergillus lucknowensis]|uniref:Uncharacterized protein n=1 Tax=Aspergillus lucknowensis TaxID=176173 RepID=A0ABR4M372_9EURO
MAHVHNVWVSRALSDPCLFLALLFAASAHRDMVQGTPHTTQTLYHQSQALKALRERVNEAKQVSYEIAASAITLTFYSMSGYNTASALIHKSGVLQMLAGCRNRGPEFEALKALANVILFGLAVVVNEEASYIRPDKALKRTDFRASDLLRRAVLRVSEVQGSLLTSDTTSQLQTVLEFITSTEHASISDLYTLHKATLMARSRETTILETESRIMTGNKTAQIINKCCRLAINIFWSTLESAVLFRGRKSLPASIDPTMASPAPPTSLEMLRAIIQGLELVTWKKHDPEACLWICLTAAAACNDPASRVPFGAVVPPLLTASDTAEVLLAKECWKYSKWLTGFVSPGTGDTMVLIPEITVGR